MLQTTQSNADRQVATWLLLCAGVIFAMIILGGVTRLTDSGLSMVEWKPLMGVIPPLSDEQWHETFDKYKQFPEYQKVNLGMSLDEFKFIFAFEYGHRVLGRLIGVMYLLPLLYFWYRGALRKEMLPSLVLLFIGGGLQGLLGWYMVKSGLVDNPDVSQYRLTAHLGFAVVLYGYMLWVAQDLWYSRDRVAAAGANKALWLVLLVFLMILSGGLVAGTRAGFTFNTWPLMGNSFFPPGLYGMEPAWLSAFEDLGTVQFNHRIFAYVLAALVTLFCVGQLRAGVSGRIRLAAQLTLAALALQLALGISTLVLQVPLVLAAAHQGGAVLLFSAVIYLAHALARAPQHA